MENFIQLIRDSSDGGLTGVSSGIIIAMIIVIGLLAILSVISLFVSLFLAVSYFKYNRKKNTVGLAGKDIARNVLDTHGLTNIRVSACGSMLFGNSYSHFFKKVRLRRLTWKKKSISSLAMATQKSALAILDSEGDKDMRARVIMTPIIYLGPLAFIPLIIIGVILDWLVFTSSNGAWTIALTAIGLAFYVLSFVMAMMVLKTEKKAQQRALTIMREKGLATEDEIRMCQKLFKLYNIQYVNDMITALLELIYRVLQIVANLQNSRSSGRK